VNEMSVMTVKEASMLSGISQSEVSNILFMGMIVPYSYSPYVSGEGKYRALLNDRNVEELKVIKKLRQANVKRRYIKSIIELLRNSKQQWWGAPDSWIVIAENRWFVTTNVTLAIKDLLDSCVLVLVKVG